MTHLSGDIMQLVEDIKRKELTLREAKKDATLQDDEKESPAQWFADIAIQFCSWTTSFQMISFQRQHEVRISTVGFKAFKVFK